MDKTPEAREERMGEVPPEALAALNFRKLHRHALDPRNPIPDTSQALLPRLIAANTAWRSTLLEECSVMQMALTNQLLNPKSLKPDTPSALATAILRVIEMQLRIVDGANQTAGTPGLEEQARDTLERHGLLAAELRQKGLGALIDRLVAGRTDGEIEPLPAAVAALMQPNATAPEAAGATNASPSISGEGGEVDRGATGAAGGKAGEAGGGRGGENGAGGARRVS
jgi:hypothetical protein